MTKRDMTHEEQIAAMDLADQIEAGIGAVEVFQNALGDSFVLGQGRGVYWYVDVDDLALLDDVEFRTRWEGPFGTVDRVRDDIRFMYEFFV